MIRFLTYALPLLLLLFACFGLAVDVLDLEPRAGAVAKLEVFEPGRIPSSVVLGIWLMEACGLLALFLMAQGRCGAWWLDGLVAGWLAWVFRGPIFVLTLVIAVRQPQAPWWDLVLAWWVLYSICGLSLAALARASGIRFEDAPPVSETAITPSGPADVESSSESPESEEPSAEDPESEAEIQATEEPEQTEPDSEMPKSPEALNPEDSDSEAPESDQDSEVQTDEPDDPKAEAGA